MSDNDAALRQHLRELLTAGNAHITFDDAVRDFPIGQVGVRASGSPHSAWELLEHIRIAQRDILLFSLGPEHGYEELKWPDDYWPASPAPADPKHWSKSIESCREDLKAFLSLLEHGDLYVPFAWGQGQTLLREALLIADHNAYHVGQIMLLRRMLES